MNKQCEACKPFDWKQFFKEVFCIHHWIDEVCHKCGKEYYFHGDC